MTEKKTKQPVKTGNLRPETNAKVMKLGRLFGKPRIDIIAQAVDQMHKRNHEQAKTEV